MSARPHAAPCRAPLARAGSAAMAAALALESARVVGDCTLSSHRRVARTLTAGHGRFYVHWRCRCVYLRATHHVRRRLGRLSRESVSFCDELQKSDSVCISTWRRRAQWSALLRMESLHFVLSKLEETASGRQRHPLFRLDTLVNQQKGAYEL